MMTLFYQSGTALSTLCWHGACFPRRKSFQSENFHAVLIPQIPFIYCAAGSGNAAEARCAGTTFGLKGISSSECSRLPAGSMMVGVTKIIRFFLFEALDS